jgi:hypothetical protein
MLLYYSQPKDQYYVDIDDALVKICYLLDI